MQWSGLQELPSQVTIIYKSDYNSTQMAKLEFKSPAPCFMSADKHHIPKTFSGISWSNRLAINGTFTLITYCRQSREIRSSAIQPQLGLNESRVVRTVTGGLRPHVVKPSLSRVLVA